MFCIQCQIKITTQGVNCKEGPNVKCLLLKTSFLCTYLCRFVFHLGDIIHVASHNITTDIFTAVALVSTFKTIAWKLTWLWTIETIKSKSTFYRKRNKVILILKSSEMYVNVIHKRIAYGIQFAWLWWSNVWSHETFLCQPKVCCLTRGIS